MGRAVDLEAEPSCAASWEQAPPLQGVPPVADLATFASLANRIDPYVAKPRVVVLTDIANEPDDQMALTSYRRVVLTIQAAAR